jgi:dipeptide/tripeptide permease
LCLRGFRCRVCVYVCSVCFGIFKEKGKTNNNKKKTETRALCAMKSVCNTPMLMENKKKNNFNFSYFLLFFLSLIFFFSQPQTKTSPSSFFQIPPNSKKHTHRDNKFIPLFIRRTKFQFVKCCSGWVY